MYTHLQKSTIVLRFLQSWFTQGNLKRSNERFPLNNAKKNENSFIFNSLKTFSGPKSSEPFE